MPRFLILLALALLINSSAGMCSAQADDRWKNGIGEPWWFDPAPMTQAEIALAKSRWEMIAANRNATADEWAGDYSNGGDTHGSFIRWSPEAGFVLFRVDKCRATVMNLDYGRASASPTLIEFFLEVNKLMAGHRHAHAQRSLRFVPVKWRGAHYLIPESEMDVFGDYVAGLGKYNDYGLSVFEWSPFFSKMGDSVDETPAQAWPQVPPGYERFLKHPIEGRITAIGRSYVRPDAENEWWDELLLPVTVNVGRAEGIKRGMKLLLTGPDDSEKIEIVRAGLHTSRGIIVRSVRKRPCVKFSEDDDCTGFDYEEIEIGRQISTSPFRQSNN
ncbi:MAG: hypothetical protein JO360_10210 [Acidobacteria bacterium]|nr:hypothetical protein [Acidobacteriota bacterium]